MKLTKHFLREVLQETVQEFSEKVVPVKEDVQLKFIDKEEFLESAKQNHLIQLQINAGFYKDFESEYPNFLVVNKADKEPFRLLLGLPFYITVCFEIAKDKLKKHTKEEVRAFLKHGFAHELAHVYEGKIKSNLPELHESALEQGKENKQITEEVLSENVADLIGDRKTAKKVEMDLWSLVYKRMENKRRG